MRHKIAAPLLFAVALAAAFFFGARAEAVRVVSYTLQPVTAAECSNISISRQLDGQGGTVLVATFSFEIEDAGGAVRETGTTAVQLTPAQRTSIANFVTSVAVPQFNAENNL